MNKRRLGRGCHTGTTESELNVATFSLELIIIDEVLTTRF
jgi:hypothetical protein